MSLQHMEPCFDQEDGVKEEKKSESSIGVVHENSSEQEILVEVDELEKAKAEMGGVREENQRLKISLNKILNEYHTLQTQLNNIVEQETNNSPDKVKNNSRELNEDSELISLSLGRLPCNPKAKVSKPFEKDEHKEDSLSLGLDWNFETSKSENTTEHLPNMSPVNSSEVPKDEGGETWQPNKVINKNVRVITREDEALSQQNPAKKARVCVRARCDTPTLNDGCQWRKYGQKISKGNPCPRAYYRCTVATSCPVRKQVQRCAQDMSILITTYEGNHNHPLPLSATAMASTTSAAASVLLSGSSTSSHSRTTPSPISIPSSNHGMNFYLSNGSKSNQLYISPPSLSSHPTITLDLTSNPPSSPFRRFTTSSNSNYPSSTSLSFNSSESNAMSWSSNGFLNSHSQSQPYNNRNNILSTMKLGTQAIENNVYYSYMQRNNNNNNNNNIFQIPSSSQYSLQDQTIVAATKAITTDPNFQSALAAALTSVIGTGSKGVGEK